MNIASTQYTLQHKSFEIYLSGCKGSCVGCCNPELKDFNYGRKLNQEIIDNIIHKISNFDLLIENIWILGGDPIDNYQYHLIHLLKILKLNTNKTIWLWTRHDIESISKQIQKCCDYIKCGEYKHELTTDDNIQYGVKLATSNQNIFKKGIDYCVEN